MSRDAVAGLGAAALLGLTACGHPAARRDGPAPTSSSASPTPTVPGARSVNVGRTVTDPILGDRVTVLTVVHGPDVLHVEVRVAAGTRFARGVDPSAFSLLEPDGGTDPAGDGAGTAMYPALADAPAGRTVTGWLTFDPAARTGLQLVYARSALTVVGSGEVVPAATYAVQLPN